MNSTTFPRRHASPLSLLLSSLVASCVSGCGQDSAPTGDGSGGASSGGASPTGAMGGVDPGGSDQGTGGNGPEENWVRVEGLECKSLPSVKGLNPAVELDSLSFYSAWTLHLCDPPALGLVETEGTICDSSEAAELCQSEVERLRAGSLGWAKYENFFEASFGLLVATGSEVNIARLGGPVDELRDGKCGSFSRGQEGWGALRPEESGSAGGAGGAGDAPWLGPSLSAEATSIRDLATLRQLLGKIDTGNEALLMFWANNHDPRCEVYLDGDDYVTVATLQINDCPFTDQDFELRITPDGEFSEAAVGEPRELGGCAGRRPDGLATSRSVQSSSAVACWLARAARLETAAVAAFAYLARDLKRIGAPKSLIARAEKAALDEIRHARAVQEIALVKGATPSEVHIQPEAKRTLLSMALENAVEGCVRECWGALVAHHQATASSDQELRRLWTEIAWDESEHAALSFDLAEWFKTKLTPQEQALVEKARLNAVEALRQEVSEVSTEHQETLLGLPDSPTAIRLFAQLELSVFRAQAA